MKIPRSAVIIAVILFALVPVAASAALITHVGDTDPTSESWGTTAGSTLTCGSAANDGGTLAWRTYDTDTTYVGYKYITPISPSPFADASGWTYTVRTRVESGVFFGGYLGVGFWINELNNYFLFCLAGGNQIETNNGIWIWFDGTTYTQVYPMDTSSAYHTYQIIYDPLQTDRVGVYVDGVQVAEVLDDYAHEAYDGDKYVAWGITGGTWCPEDAYWNYVAFETGQHPVPLPGAVWLLGSGLLSLGAAGWRRRIRD